MKPQRTFNDRLARISEREGMGAELLAGVCESENRPKVKLPTQKKRRKSSANPLLLSMLALGMLGGVYYAADGGDIQSIDFASLTTKVQTQIEVTKVQFASYME